MADDSRFRFSRPGESYRRAAAEPLRASERPNDPLAELARLIGKNDPYAEFGLSTEPSEAPEEGYSREERYSQQERYSREDYSPVAPAHSEHDDRRHASYEAAPHQEAEQPHEESYEESYSSESYREPYGEPHHETYSEPHHETYSEQQHEPYSEQQHEPYQEAQGGRHYRYDAGAPLHNEEAHAEYADAPAYDVRPGHYHDEDVHAGDLHAGDRYAEDEPSLDPGLDPDLEQTYDDPPRAHRRGGLATALALIGCAMLGTAGAYAYRSFHGPQAVAGPPPVITADNSTPTKIVPAQAGDAQSGKAVQDRLADAGKEQVVAKQEEPVADKDLGTQAVPRVVLPAPVAPMPAAPRVPFASQQAPLQAPSGAPAASSTEPRKVRTVTIRPDGTEVVPPAPGATRAARGPVGGPISLDPQSQEPVAAPVAAPVARPRIAAAPAAAAGAASGGFMVQLSSQKTEAEAAASFRSLQAKFPDQLSDRSPIIRRVDLGSKGVFYRTMVGPFATGQEASQFCATYKAAGGQCVVPSN